MSRAAVGGDGAKRSWPFVGLSALILAGCAVGPDYRRPDFDLPQDWRAVSEPIDADVQPAKAIGERWWSLYADPVLDQLIDEALQHNSDAAIATARVLEAKALSKAVDADLYPSFAAGFSVDRTRSSQLGAFPISGVPRTQTSYRATLDARYEVDLWGRYRRASEAAHADLFAAVSARDAVRLSLTAEVAQQYFTLLALDAQSALTQRALDSRRETVDLFAKRLSAGTLAEFDLLQAEAETAVVRAQLARLQQLQDRAESTLALLLGRSPRAVMETRVARGTPTMPNDALIPADLPSELLLRRPDLREAEARLMAANARIGSARAQYFPAVGLTAYLGSESVEFSRLFSGPAGIFQFAAAITQPLWNAGRIDAGVEISEARRDQALAQYRHAVAGAFKDMRDALGAQRAAHATQVAESARSRALEKALEHAQQRFEAGIASRLEVLDVERNLLAAELALAESERARKAALTDIVKALGGGWAGGDGAQPPEPR